MPKKMVDIIEDLDKGLNMKQLAQKPQTEGEKKDGAVRIKDEEDRK